MSSNYLIGSTTQRWLEGSAGISLTISVMFQICECDQKAVTVGHSHRWRMSRPATTCIADMENLLANVADADSDLFDVMSRSNDWQALEENGCLSNIPPRFLFPCQGESGETAQQRWSTGQQIEQWNLSKQNLFWVLREFKISNQSWKWCDEAIFLQPFWLRDTF